MLKNILIAIILISMLTDVFLFFRFKKYIRDHAKEEVDKHKTVLLSFISVSGSCDGERVVNLALRNKDSRIIGLGGKDCGDIFFTIEEGYNRLHGDSLTTAQGYYNTSVTPVFIAAGKGIKQNFVTERVIRQVDVAPTISTLLGIRATRQCEGAPVYQILES